MIDRVVIHEGPGATRALFLERGRVVEIWVEGHDAPGQVGGVAVVTARTAGGAAIVALPTGSGYIRDTRPGDGERVMVEVMREADRNKRAVVRQRLELAGPTVVLTPHQQDFGIASTIKAKGKRAAIKAALQPLLPTGVGAMVRSAAADLSPIELADEMLRLVAVWQSITDRALTATPPAWLVPPPSLTARATMHAPAGDLVIDTDGTAFRAAGGEEALDRALADRVDLASGASLIIEEGETATLIDVNLAASPRGVGLVGANCDVVTAVVAHARLRGLRGTVLIDLPRMRGRADRDQVQEAMAQAAAEDPAPWQIFGWTPGGMIECVRESARRSVSRELLAPPGEARLSVRARAWAALDTLRRDVGRIARPRLVVPGDVAGWLEGPGAAIVIRERQRLGALTIVADPTLGPNEALIDDEG